MGDPLQTEAARQQLAALDRYERELENMMAAHASGGLFGEMIHSLEDVRQAALLNPRNLLFNTTQLVLAHSNLASKLWQRWLAAQADGPSSLSVSDAEIESLRQDHRRAVERLRDRCTGLLIQQAQPRASL